MEGATKYMSDITKYMHIICFESCGKRIDPTKMSRNLVFIRDERVAGANTFDDTLSTMTEEYFGRKSPAINLSPCY